MSQPTPMNDKSLMPYGKFKGVEMANVPASYLLWMRDNINQDDDINKAICAYIDDNLDVLESESDIIDRGPKYAR